MGHAELEQFRATLEGMLAKLGMPLLRRDEIAIESSADALDQVGNLADRELAVSQLELVSNRYNELRSALRRVADGTYGICLECESDISAKRLKAVPWTPYCISCQELIDHDCSRAGIDWKPIAALCRR
ncbi:MAG: TraR/DksA family transcriptional regulator [Acidobacteriaceae bacterium]|nr:TraR/DksA family transcriptional regulator [Acidobacteriaceae bacterium]MBV9497784.1 TraR/DksA family transcriptional regulator [Acidobacteriaceae bacterium]